MNAILQAPFPWYGGKSRVQKIVWERFGDVPNYVEPFAGSLAVLLGRPTPPRIETVNDADSLLANFWRSIQADPEQVATWANWPINEADLHARHVWLIQQIAGLTDHLAGDPDYYDAKVAGWWVWGLCSWIGSGWCSGEGPWWPDGEGKLVDTREPGGVKRQLPHLGNAGQGINRQLPTSGTPMGINRKLPHLGDAGQGINRKRPHLGNAGQGINRQLPTSGTPMGINRKLGGELTDDCENEAVTAWFLRLQERLRFVRVCCGDWTRVMGPSVTTKHGLTGVFLDPPYAVDDRADLYRKEDFSVAKQVLDWCLTNGHDPLLRIALCGYDGEHNVLESHGWSVQTWKAHGGYGSQGEGQGRANAHRERIWFSPACLSINAAQGSLF